MPGRFTVSWCTGRFACRTDDVVEAAQQTARTSLSFARLKRFASIDDNGARRL